MDQYGLTSVTAPTEEPVSLAEAKAWLRLSHDADDARVQGLISTARLLAEREYDRQLVTATWRLTLPRFPTWEIRLPRGPLQSISSIQYRDTSGTLQTLSASYYEADAALDPGLVQPAYGRTWPSTRDMVQAVRITFVAGYGTPQQVPQSIRNALKMAVAWWFERPGDDADTVERELPAAVHRLLRLHWNGVFA